jgi:hypothetical protein
MAELLLLQLFSSITEAVLSYFLDKYDPEMRIREWVKQEPAKIAYQKALYRAYTAFARQYPDFTASLFNESFLMKEGASELAKQLTRHLSPDPAILAKAWAASIYSPHLIETKLKTFTPACADFLCFLEAELKAEAIFQPLFDSRALETLPAIETHLARLLAELPRAITDASAYDEVVNIGFQIAESSAISGDLIYGGKVTKIYNTYYSGNFNQLRDLYIPPDDVMQRVHVSEFVGREWLITEVDSFISKSKSGVFVLEGEAGVGKTSFLAYLVNTRRYLHLFAEQVPGDSNIPRALQSLASQIVTRFRIDEYVRRDTLPEIASFPDFLSKLLRLASAKLATDEKIVIVCDALDEAGIGSNGNAFGLPSVIPEKVYLILSQRPIPLKYYSKEFAPRIERLDPASSKNKDDVTAYLSIVSRRPEILGQLRAQGYNETNFVQTLSEKSGGVWMYLYYVIDEITQGVRAPLDLKTLPNGLGGYYTQYWQRWRNDILKWDTLYAPLLATLAAAREAISLDQLIQWAGVTEIRYLVQRLIDDNWRAFVNRDDCRRYALYHASLRDFLTADSAILNSTSDISEVDNNYARRHLIAHLGDAGQYEELFGLVAMSDIWAKACYEKDGSYTEYLGSLGLAWQLAESQEKWNLNRQILCALIESSIHSLAGNISPDLLIRLMATKIWSPAQALSHIRYLPSESQRVIALRTIAPFLTQTLSAEAIEVARTIIDQYARCDTLIGLAPFLSDETRAQVYKEVSNLIPFHWIQMELALYTDYTDKFAASTVREQLWQAWAIRDENLRYKILDGLLSLLPESIKLKTALQALSKIRSTIDNGNRARIISELLHSLPRELWTKETQKELSLAYAISDHALRVETLIWLTMRWRGKGKQKVMTDALQSIRAIESEDIKAETIKRIAGCLSPKYKVEFSRIAKDIENAILRNKAMAALNITRTPRSKDLLSREEYRQLTEAIIHTNFRSKGRIIWGAEGRRDINYFRNLENIYFRGRSPLEKTLEQQILNEQDILIILVAISDPNARSRSSHLDETIARLLKHTVRDREAWRSFLHKTAGYGRVPLLLCLYHLAPIIAKEHGNDSLSKMILSMYDVSLWWP